MSEVQYNGLASGTLLARQYACRVLLDNYDPPRKEDVVYVWYVTAENSKSGRETFILDTSVGGGLKDEVESIYLFDDGSGVIPLFVAGWSVEGKVFLSRFPLSEGTCPDGRPVDMSGWALGPRRAYHLKASPLG